MKIVIDTNIWISFAIGKRLSELERIFTSPNIRIFVCDKLLEEVSATLLKPKLQKYVSEERRKMLLSYEYLCTLKN
jgi:putative PIN family toxin of toxin-antitoxin system